VRCPECGCGGLPRQDRASQWLTTLGRWGITAPWVLIGLVVIGVSAVTGAAFLGPEANRGAAGGRARSEDQEVQLRIRRGFLVARIELFLLVLGSRT
jgi:hypothetical protein